MKYIQILKNQIKSHTISITLFIVAYIISVLGLSVVVSDFNSKVDYAYELNSGINSNSVNLTLISDKIKSLDKYLFSDINKNSYISFDFDVTFDNASNENFYLSAYYFNDSEPNFYPIKEGRFIKNSDIQENKKVMVIGKNLEEFVYSKDDNKFINIGDEVFEIIGMLESKNKDSLWNYSCFVPLTSIPKQCLNSNFLGNYSSILTSADGCQATDISSIGKKLKTIDSNSMIETGEIDNASNFVSNVLLDNSRSLDIIKSILFFSVLNIICVSIFWIKDRRKEIAIRKAFGFSNKQISYLLISEFLSITIFASLITIIINILLALILKLLFDYTLIITYLNLIAIIVMSIFIAIIISIIPIIKSLSYQPIELIKDNI